jgi:hypothetical protein
MPAPRPVALAVAIGCAVVAAAGVRLAASDRDARVITPDGSPVWLDPTRAILFDTPTLAIGARNRHSALVTFALRVWVFDSSSKLVGMLDYCAGDALDRDMRGRVLIPVDIRGVTLRDHAVVTVAAASAEGVSWTLHQTAADQLEAARAAARGASGRLTFDRRDRDRAGAWTCPCECPRIQATCAERCADTGLAAFTCAPIGGAGCSASCSCK